MNANYLLAPSINGLINVVVCQSLLSSAKVIFMHDLNMHKVKDNQCSPTQAQIFHGSSGADIYQASTKVDILTSCCALGLLVPWKVLSLIFRQIKDVDI